MIGFQCLLEKVSQKVLAELYNSADLCVSRSITESFGLALVEAMFCDVPVDVPKIGVFWDWDFFFSILFFLEGETIRDLFPLE